MPKWAHRYLLLGSVFYRVLFVVGMIAPQSSEANFVSVNPAYDDTFHLCLGVAMVLLGTTLSRRLLITPGMLL